MRGRRLKCSCISHYKRKNQSRCATSNSHLFISTLTFCGPHSQKSTHHSHMEKAFSLHQIHPVFLPATKVAGGSWDKPLYKKGMLICIALPLLPLGESWKGQDWRKAKLTRAPGPWTSHYSMSF